jgi:hypothetical protein
MFVNIPSRKDSIFSFLFWRRENYVRRCCDKKHQTLILLPQTYAAAELKKFRNGATVPSKLHEDLFAPLRWVGIGCSPLDKYFSQSRAKMAERRSPRNWRKKNNELRKVIPAIVTTSCRSEEFRGNPDRLRHSKSRFLENMDPFSRMEQPVG